MHSGLSILYSYHLFFDPHARCILDMSLVKNVSEERARDSDRINSLKRYMLVGVSMVATLHSKTTTLFLQFCPRLRSVYLTQIFPQDQQDTERNIKSQAKRGSSTNRKKNLLNERRKCMLSLTHAYSDAYFDALVQTRIRAWIHDGAEEGFMINARLIELSTPTSQEKCRTSNRKEL